MSKATSNIRTINRICDIINTFDENHKSLTLTEISLKIGLPKSTTHRLLEALVELDLLVQDQSQHGYRPGYQLIRWGAITQNSIDIRNMALPVMRSLTKNTGETSVLSIRSGNYGIWVDIIESQNPVRLATRTGKPMPLTAGASFKVLLAFLPDKEIDLILEHSEFLALLPKSIIDKKKLKEDFNLYRNLGYAISYEEINAGVMGIAAPVFDHSSSVMAGMGIIAPISRIPQSSVNDITPKIVEAAFSLSKMLGAHRS